MKNSLFQRGFAALGIVMVVATITLVGFVAFRFLDAQDNTQVADNTPQPSSRVASVETTKDVQTVSQELESTDIESLDSELDGEFSF